MPNSICLRKSAQGDVDGLNTAATRQFISNSNTHLGRLRCQYMADFASSPKEGGQIAHTTKSLAQLFLNDGMYQSLQTVNRLVSERGNVVHDEISTKVEQDVVRILNYFQIVSVYCFLDALDKLAVERTWGPRMAFITTAFSSYIEDRRQVPGNTRLYKELCDFNNIFREIRPDLFTACEKALND